MFPRTASRYLQSLTQIGVLEGREVGREKLYLHPQLMHLLTRQGNDLASVFRRLMNL